MRRVTIKMVLSVTAAVLVARTLLQGAARMLAKHATDELYQLTVIAFCLVGAWISGYLVRLRTQAALATGDSRCFASSTQPLMLQQHHG